MAGCRHLGHCDSCQAGEKGIFALESSSRGMRFFSPGATSSGNHLPYTAGVGQAGRGGRARHPKPIHNAKPGPVSRRMRLLLQQDLVENGTPF